MERERAGGYVDPDGKARSWEEKVAECSRLRRAYQDQQAAGLMTLEELGAKLKDLEGIRKVAEAELARLNAREERARKLEADRDALMASYVETVPEALDGLSGEERSRVYEMLGLEVKPDPEGYEVSEVSRKRRPKGRSR